MVLQGNGLKRTLMEAVLEATRRATEIREELAPGKL
jgi:pyrroline-5-carboxylate reductase